MTLGERRESDPNPSPSKKKRTGDPPKKGNVRTGGSPNSCKVCGKKHLGECFYKTKPCPNCQKTGHVLTNCPSKLSVCFGCYQPGHKKADCPNAPKPGVKTEPGKEPIQARARSFQITAAEPKSDPGVVTGIPII